METNAVTQSAANDTKSTLQLLNEARTKQVAREFESIFTTMMLKSMRATVQTDENPFIPNSFGQKVYTDMLDDEYGKMMSEHSSIGIAKLIEQQLLKQPQATSSPLSMLTELKMQPWLLDSKFIPQHQQGTDTADTKSKVSRWNPVIEKAASAYNVDPSLISAVIAQESGGDPTALSVKGAKGLMQLMDSTATDLGVKRSFDPTENIMAGSKYLRQLLDQFKGNETLALAAYNAGPSAVQQYNGIPPYPETQQYVSSVLAQKDKFSQSAAATSPQGTHQ